MERLTIKKLTELIMEQARKKGFGTKPEEVDIPEKIALIHSEISEAFDAYRHKKIDGKGGLKEELGDAVQRVLHLCGIMGIDVEKEIIKKLESNKDRDWNWKEMNEKHS
ncbi:MAG: hypothetical protein JSV92_04255 [archaeon]|nr:MAG: hypothetical protein JSV92_04255 [archaeon]